MFRGRKSILPPLWLVFNCSSPPVLKVECLKLSVLLSTGNQSEKFFGFCGKENKYFGLAASSRAVSRTHRVFRAKRVFHMSCSVFICLLYSKRKPCSQNKHTELPSLKPCSTSLKDCMSGDFPFRQTAEQHWAPHIAEGLSVPSSTSVDPTEGVAPCTACYERHACLFELQSKQN